MIGGDGCHNVNASGTFLFPWGPDDGCYETAERPPKKIRRMLLAGHWGAWRVLLAKLHDEAETTRAAALEAYEAGEDEDDDDDA